MQYCVLLSVACVILNFGNYFVNCTIFQNSPVQNYTKTRPFGVMLFHVVGHRHRHRHNETSNRSLSCASAQGHVTIKKEKPCNYRPAYWVTFRQRSDRDDHCFTLVHRDCGLEKRRGCEGRDVMRNEVGGGGGWLLLQDIKNPYVACSLNKYTHILQNCAEFKNWAIYQ